jgi:hypothetical protein
MRHRLIPPASAVLFLSLAAVWTATPAGADWLVLRDGSRVETQGVWQVKGKQVVFTARDGKLSALRLVDVDLDASARATAPPPAAEAAVPVEPEKKKAVLVLTDKDVGHVNESGDPVQPAEAAKEGADGAQAKPDAAPAQPAGGVVVDSWERTAMADSSGVEIFGSIKNTGTNTATDITVVAKVYDESGGLLGTADAKLGAGILPPSRTTNFRATFAGILSFATARFEVQNRSLLTQSPPPPAGSSTR